MKSRIFFFAVAFLALSATTFSQDAQEPNDSFGAAKTVSAGTTLACSIHTTADQDNFKMTVPTGGTITVDIPTNSTALALRIEVFGSTGSNPLITNEVSSVAGGGVSLAAVVPAGAWYIVVRRNSGTASQTLFNVTFGFDNSDACEFNNDFGTACPVSLPATIQAKLWGVNDPTQANYDIDYYRVTVGSGGVLTANIPANSTGVQIRLRVIADDASTEIASSVAGAANGAVSAAAVVPAGTYYIAVSRNTGALSPNPYTLSLAFDTTDQCEFNNDFGKACTIQPNSTTQAQLWGVNNPTQANNDIDYYRVTTQQAGVLEASIPTNATGVQIRLQIYADDASTQLAASTATAINAAVSVPAVVPAGTYFVVVSRNTGALSANPYTLNMKLDTADDGEWNNDLATAKVVQPNTTLQAHLWGINYPTADNEDVDYYKITLAAAGDICVNIPVNSTQMIIRIQLYNQAGSVIANAVSNAMGSQTTLQKSVAAGTYFIKVSRNSGQPGPQVFAVQFACPGASGVEQVDADAFYKIFPNPATDILRVEFTEAVSQPVRLYLSNVSGNIVLEKRVNNPAEGFTELNIRDLSSGVYFLTLETEKGTAVRRVVIAE